MTLSDADVDRQIKHMMAFIEQEANEKAEEIDAKAEEEFNIEKGRLVQQQRIKIKDYYERKEKQVDVQRKIQSSNMLNQARLKVLKSREDYVQNVLNDARKQLSSISRDQSRYPKIVEGLIAQGLCQLLEANVTVRCRQADLEVVESSIPLAVASVKEIIKIDVNVLLDRENFLSSDCAGGVELYARKDRIKVDNSLEARLSMISQSQLPKTRSALFGGNANRKFTD